MSHQFGELDLRWNLTCHNSFDLGFLFIECLSFKLIFKMVKRSRTMSTSVRRVKRRTTGKRSLNKVAKDGDIPQSVLDKFSSRYAAPRFARAKLHYIIPPINGGILGGAGAGLNFQLSSGNGYLDFTAAYDQYRIVAVEIRFSPYGNSHVKTADFPGRLFTCIDYDDAGAPANAAEVMEFGNCEITNSYNKAVRRFKPRVASALYSGAFTSFGNVEAPWIDAASPSVQHYGVKLWAEASTTVASVWTIDAALYVEFRGQR